MNDLKKQKLLILLCCLIYSFAYAGRYSYSANIVLIIELYGVSRADAGLVSTFFFFAYGAGQFVNAIFCRFYSRKYIIPIALFFSAVVNLALLFAPPFEIIKYLWLLNGMCQSVLWPTLILTLSKTLDECLMKRAVLIMSLPVLIGTFLAYGGGALFALGNRFQMLFLLSAVLMIGTGVIWFCFYRTLTADKTETTIPTNSVNEIEKTGNVRKVVSASLIGLLFVCMIYAIVDNFIRDGMNTWLPVILKEQFGYGDSISMVMILVLPFFGVLSSFLALRTNRIIKDFRMLIGFFYLLISVCIGGLVISMKQNIVSVFLICQGMIACFANGISAVLTSIMPLALRKKINPGFLAGLMDASCYVGSAVSAYGLGVIADGSGWNMVIQILLIAAILAVTLTGIVLFALITKKASRKNQIQSHT